jgi:tyrosinase
MVLNFIINYTAPVPSDYIGWKPIPCCIYFTDVSTTARPLLIKFSNNGVAGGGKVLFFLDPAAAGADMLTFTVPGNGQKAYFWMAGDTDFPSINDKDASVRVINRNTYANLGSKKLMVRVRKDADKLTTGERDRFLNAFGILNSSGKFQTFRDMHVSASLQESHGNLGFLPWHRAYLLDLERELQLIDPSVSLPYWRFNFKAPNVFSTSFMGTSDINGNVQFTASNPFKTWKVDSVAGITRRPRFDTTNAPANRILNDEVETLVPDPFLKFSGMESDPHGTAHTSFRGFLGDPATAPKDPLFFLLHTNVDRLWAKWQWANQRIDITSTNTYTYLGSSTDPNAIRIGHNGQDTMWPWNNVIAVPRPGTAPGGALAGRADVPAPGPSPKVLDMVDYQGKITPSSYLGYDYDDVFY